MFNTIVVGIDDTSRGRDALALASVVAGSANPDVTLVHVHAPGDHDEAQRFLTDVVRAGPAGARTAIVSGRHVAAALCAFADRSGADLLVIGSSRRGAFGRVLLGDVSRAVAHSAACAVAVAPRNYAREPHHVVRVVGVGIDGSLPGNAALRSARSLAEQLGAELRIVVALGSALPPPTPVPLYGGSWQRYRVRAHRHAEDLLADAIANSTVRASGSVREERSGTALTRLSQQCDMVFVGARSANLADRLLAGSASDALLSNTACPVVLVPPPRPAATATAVAAARVSTD